MACINNGYFLKHRILNMNVMYVASDNCLSSGAIKSMVKLCELERDIYNINPIVVLPYYGDGEELLKSAKLNYVYVKSED